MENLEIPRIHLDSDIIALIGFALKAGQVIRGFDAVCRMAEQKSLSVILLNAGISGNTEKKLIKILKSRAVPIFKTDENVNWEKRWGLDAQKVFGVLKGNLGSSVVNKINAGV